MESRIHLGFKELRARVEVLQVPLSVIRGGGLNSNWALACKSSTSSRCWICWITTRTDYPFLEGHGAFHRRAVANQPKLKSAYLQTTAAQAWLGGVGFCGSSMPKTRGDGLHSTIYAVYVCLCNGGCEEGGR